MQGQQGHMMEICESEKEWLRIRWEFLRRDPEYLRVWKQMQDFHAGRIKIDEGDKSMAEFQEAASSLKEVLMGYDDFGLSSWVDPALGFDKVVQDSELLSCLLNRKSHSVLVDLPVPTCDHMPATMSIHIDLARVRSITALKQYVWNIIHEELQNVSRTQVRDRDYEKILRAGILKEQGKSHSEIADAIYENDVDRDNAINKVGKLLKRFEKSRTAATCA